MSAAPALLLSALAPLAGALHGSEPAPFSGPVAPGHHSPAANLAGPPRAPLAMRQDTLPAGLFTRVLPGGARLLLYRRSEDPLVAIRVSFPLYDGAGHPAAFARMAQWLIRQELRREAGAYGARVDLETSERRASFAIVGPARDIAELIAVLRRAITWRDWSDDAVRTARLAEATRAYQEVETPEPLLRLRLAARLLSAPAHDPPDSVPEGVGAATLRRFWVRSFDPGQMEAVVVGRANERQAVQLLSGWPRAGSAEPDEPEAETATAVAPRAQGTPSARKPRPAGGRRPATPPPTPTPPPSIGRPQVLFGWAAVGWPMDTEPATAAVVARLVLSRLRGAALRTATAELWWSSQGRALVALGAAVGPDSVAPRPAGVLSSTVAEVASSLTASEVAAARLDIAREILFTARTTQGLARYLGDMLERTGDPLAGPAFLRALQRVDADGVEGALRGLGEPIVVEVRQ